MRSVTPHSQFESHQAIVAHHEAGHAVMALACDFTVTAISISASETGEGFVAYDVPKPIEGNVAKKAALVSVSGLAADMLLATKTGKQRLDGVFQGIASDWLNAKRYVRLAGDEGSVEDYLLASQFFLFQYWSAVESLALRLMHYQTILPRNLDSSNFPRLPADWQAILRVAVERNRAKEGASGVVPRTR